MSETTGTLPACAPHGEAVAQRDGRWEHITDNQPCTPAADSLTLQETRPWEDESAAKLDPVERRTRTIEVVEYVKPGAPGVAR
ncbi:hypothetical protein [Sphaerisporangium sp. NPDC051011]|uniref:hypothetical protein n=1 Tax=Sphaerisporangium sp. NPDC051011 TaxID=3155792 RepID=UPI0033CE4978